ncbi:MAG: aminodeoxychorismate/anthranilate synthase component II [Candidatus Hydrogenedentes bacterium]|nr:aminodeoxychorismate/anthranilate synthase component II [Candidatus Hydrogenedentota bacterium]
MIVLIDNYDSFTYNLVQYFGELESDIRVFRNDKISVDDVAALRPDHVVISPGPCTPNEAGISVALIQAMAGKAPILGVCLGHQSIGAAFGGNIIRAERIMHGKVSQIIHQGGALFANVPSPFTATRYHSLVIERHSCPSVLEITAETAEGEIMAVAHKELPIFGVQFHPESILTESGKTIIRNFLRCRGTAWPN